MDHDFLKGEGRERPFTPPPEQPILHWLIALLTLLVIAYAGYRLMEQLSRGSPAAAIKPANVSSAPPTAQTPQQVPSNIPSKAGARIVTKCLSNGKTTYGDGDCPADAETSQVMTKENQNLMDAVRIPTTSPTADTSAQATVITRGKEDARYTATKAECAAWDERVKYLDAMARQPLDGPTQDWIRSERKNARDRQARIPCR